MANCIQRYVVRALALAVGFVLKGGGCYLFDTMETKRTYEQICDRLKFVQEIKEGMRVNTPMGNGIVKSVIEDIHCHVNVILDGGSVTRNFMLDELYYEG